ncbi:MAG TPA: hypothetical protein VLG13_02980 [Patescibacteria group bacterium]|nr:hypothetical protein [Patescibacteria group bacterium]
MERNSTQSDSKSDYLTGISKYAHDYSVQVGGNRYFPALVQQIAIEVGGGYELTSKERAAIQAGVLSVSANRSKVEIPRQKTHERPL